MATRKNTATPNLTAADEHLSQLQGDLLTAKALLDAAIALIVVADEKQRHLDDSERNARAFLKGILADAKDTICGANVEVDKIEGALSCVPEAAEAAHG